MDAFFSKFGGKTKFFTGLLTLLVTAESLGWVPAGTGELIVQGGQLFSAAGIVFGFRDAIAKIGA